MRRLSKYASIAPPIGSPTSVRRSPRTTALSRSPTRFAASTPTAKRWPQRRSHRSPTAAPAQVAATVRRSGTAQGPRLPKASRASGLSRHIGSSAEPGRAKDAALMPLMSVPKAKNPLNAVNASGRSGVTCRMAPSGGAVWLTTCASAAGHHAGPAQSYVPQRAHGALWPSGGWRPLRPVGCIRGLGRTDSRSAADG